MNDLSVWPKRADLCSQCALSNQSASVINTESSYCAPSSSTYTHTKLFPLFSRLSLFVALNTLYAHDHGLQAQHATVSANQNPSLCTEVLWLSVIKVSVPGRLSVIEAKCPWTATLSLYVLISSDLRLSHFSNNLLQQNTFID